MDSRMIGYGLGVVVIAGVMGVAAFSRAGFVPADVPLHGSRIRLVDTGDPGRRRNFVSLLDADVDVGTVDPRSTGATARLGRIGVDPVAVLSLPAGGWTRANAAPTDYRYRSRTGPVVSARLVDGKLVRLSARGAGAYGLGGTSQGAVGVIVEVGPVRFCAVFGGVIAKDDGTKFLARTAPAPAACPILGAGSTSTTTETSTTSSTEPTTTTDTSTTSTTETTTTTTTASSTSSTDATTTTTSTTTTTTTTQPPCVPDQSASPRLMDNGDGTVTDRQTCLVWEQKTTTVGSGANLADLHDVDNVYSWAGCCDGNCNVLCQPNAAAAATCAAQADGGTQGCSTCASGTCDVDAQSFGAITTVWDWLNQLNDASFAGHDDWRLPSMGACNSCWSNPTSTCSSCTPHELETIRSAPYGTCLTPPCIDATFGPTASKEYWSASTWTTAPLAAWRVDFTYGFIYHASKSWGLAVRAVR